MAESDKERLLKYLNAYPIKPVTETTRRFRGMFFGPYGGGKTTLGAASGRPTLICSIGDKGYSALKGEYANLASQVPLAGLAHLKAIGKAITADVEGYGRYTDGVVLVDTVSSLSSRFLTNQVEYVRVGKNSDRLVVTKRAGVQSPDYDDDFVGEFSGLRDYGVLKELFQKALNDTIEHIPADLIWIAWEIGGPSKDKEGKDVFIPYQAELPQATRNVVSAPCDVIGRIYKDISGRRKLDCRGTTQMVGKSRIPTLEKQELIIQDCPEKFWELVEQWRVK